ncbi:MAG: agmatinase [Acidobacteriota bacterium]
MPDPKFTVSTLGVPYDDSSSFLRGAAQAPNAIREAFRSPSSNTCCEAGFDLDQHPYLTDAGDLAFEPGGDPFERIETAVGELLDAGNRVLTLGGDHAIAYPILEAYGRRFERLTLLQLDAHPDLYDELDGNYRSHACPFARIMEDGLVARLVQVGIRTLNPHQRMQAERFDVEIIDMRQWRPDAVPELEAPLYLSLDLDVLDPAFAPGVSHHEPGGLSVREVIRIIQDLAGPVVGADLVELNPTRDPTGVTAMVAAKLYKEIAGKMLEPLGTSV